MTYFQWFFKNGGWKSGLTLGMLVGLIIGIAMGFYFDEWWNADNIVMSLVLPLIIIGFEIGIVSSSINVWKISQSTN